MLPLLTEDKKVEANRLRAFEYCSLLFIIAVASCDLCDPSLGFLEDISPAQIYRADLTSVVFFPLSFVAIYSVNETYISSFQFFQILFFSVFLFLCSTFPLFYLNYIDKFVHLSMVFHAISNHQLLITVKTDLPLNVSCNQSDFCDS